jgi:hypothetical protein
MDPVADSDHAGSVAAAMPLKYLSETWAPRGARGATLSLDRDSSLWRMVSRPDPRDRREWRDGHGTHRIESAGRVDCRVSELDRSWSSRSMSVCRRCGARGRRRGSSAPRARTVSHTDTPLFLIFQQVYVYIPHAHNPIGTGHRSHHDREILRHSIHVERRHILHREINAVVPLIVIQLRATPASSEAMQ